MGLCASGVEVQSTQVRSFPCCMKGKAYDFRLWCLDGKGENTVQGTAIWRVHLFFIDIHFCQYPVGTGAARVCSRERQIMCSDLSSQA